MLVATTESLGMKILKDPETQSLVIDLFSLYIWFCPCRPRGDTRENSSFEIRVYLYEWGNGFNFFLSKYLCIVKMDRDAMLD